MKSQATTTRQIRTSVHKYTKLIAWAVIMLSMVLINELKAQHAYGSVFIQNTIAGLQQGTEIGFLTQKQFAVGAFFQSTEILNVEKSVHNYPYYGVTLQAPIKTSCNGVSFLAQVKTGVVNNEFIVVTPQLETQLDITSFLKVGFNMGYRAGHSAIGARVILNL